MKCPKCESENYEFDETKGAAFCTDCGEVLQDNTLVSNIIFDENPGGESTIQGTFVPIGPNGLSKSADYSAGAYRNRVQDTQESREARIQKGRKRIQQMVSALNLSNHHAESALRLYRLAVQHNFVTGRRTINVIAVCLYTICRREQTPHLLLDFSDLLQTNVYVLGGIYLKLLRVLKLPQPLIDPALFIPRYSAQLEFGDKTHLVTMTAIRLVHRMKRDWLQYGRRPHGLSGACLLIAARMHGFRRTQAQIAQCVRIGCTTLSKRLVEFSETPAATLTAEEFNELDLDEECDPPAYRRLRLSEKEEQEKLAALSVSNSVDVEKEISQEMLSTEFLSIGEEDKSTSSQNSNKLNAQQPVVAPSLNAVANSIASLAQSIQGMSKSAEAPKQTSQSTISTEIVLSEAANIQNSASLNVQNVPVTQITLKRPKRQYTQAELTKESLSDLSDDEEIADCLLDPEEKALKGEVWDTVNAEYIEQQAAKALLPEKVVKPKKPRNKKKKDGTAETAAEAVMNHVKEHGVSQKLNYEAVEQLLGLPSSAGQSSLHNRSETFSNSSSTAFIRSDALKRPASKKSRLSSLTSSAEQSMSNKFSKPVPMASGRMVLRGGRMQVVYDSVPNPDPVATIATDHAVLERSASIIAEERVDEVERELEPIMEEDVEDVEIQKFKEQYRLGSYLQHDDFDDGEEY